MLKHMVTDMQLAPGFQNRFFEGLLLPDKLTAEYMKLDPTEVEKIFLQQGYGSKTKRPRAKPIH